MSNQGKPTNSEELVIWNGTKFVSKKISNANIDSSAAISGSKITPDFGSQNIIGQNLTLSGSINFSSGNSPTLSYVAVELSSDANYTLLNTQYSKQILSITSSVSLSATRNIIFPLTSGASWYVTNSTTGSQSIIVKGVTGTGVTIENGNSAIVYTDGTNFIQAVTASGSASSVTWAGDLLGSTNTSQSVVKLTGSGGVVGPVARSFQFQSGGDVTITNQVLDGEARTINITQGANAGTTGGVSINATGNNYSKVTLSCGTDGNIRFLIGGGEYGRFNKYNFGYANHIYAGLGNNSGGSLDIGYGDRSDLGSGGNLYVGAQHANGGWGASGGSTYIGSGQSYNGSYGSIFLSPGATAPGVRGPGYNKIDAVQISAIGNYSSGLTGTTVTFADTAQVKVNNLTASQFVKTDADKKLVSQSGVSLADLGNSGGAAGDVAYWNGTNWVRSAQSALVYRAIDANHIHVYKCDETSGATVTDSGSGAKDLTLTGAENTAYVRGTMRGARFARGLSLYADATSRGAYSATTAAIAGDPVTIEVVTVPGNLLPSFQSPISIDAGNNDYFIIGTTGTDYKWWAIIRIGGVDRSTGANGWPIRLGVRQHLMATYDRTASPSLCFYVDGTLVASEGTMTSAAPTWTRVSIGNLGPSQSYAYTGAIYDARVSNVARDAAYARQAAEAAWRL